MSRFVNLLKEIPPGNEEIPEILLKQLDIAAYDLVRNQAGQYDITEEERRNISGNDLEEVSGRYQKWGLLDKFPLSVGELMIWPEENGKWALGLSFGANPRVELEIGSKERILELRRSLNEIRAEEGEEAYEEEIMRKRSRYLGEWDD